MGFLVTVMNDKERILAVGIVRPVAKPSDGLIPYEYDLAGKHLFVDLYVADSPLGLAALTAVFGRHFGARETVSFLRKDETSLRTYSHSRIRSKIVRRQANGNNILKTP